MFLNFIFLFSFNIDSSDRIKQRVIPLVVLLILTLVFIVFYFDKMPHWLNNGIFIWYLVFTTYCILSLTWSLQPRIYEFANFKSFIIILVLLFIYGTVIQNEKDLILGLKSIIWANMGIIVVMIGKIGIANLFSGRAGSAIGLNANGFGTQCSFAALLSLFLLEGGNKKYIVSFGISALMALVSGSRKAFFMLAAGIALQRLLEMEKRRVIRNILILAILMISICNFEGSANL